MEFRINLRPLLQNIIDHAMEWKNTLGNILADKTKTNLLDLQMELKVSVVDGDIASLAK